MITEPLAEIEQRALNLLCIAEDLSVVLTISQKPLLPLAMGNYETVVEVRQKLVRE